MVEWYRIISVLPKYDLCVMNYINLIYNKVILVRAIICILISSIGVPVLPISTLFSQHASASTPFLDDVFGKYKNYENVRSNTKFFIFFPLFTKVGCYGRFLKRLKDSFATYCSYFASCYSVNENGSSFRVNSVTDSTEPATKLSLY